MSIVIRDNINTGFINSKMQPCPRNLKGGGSSFSNLYSIEFDGIDEYMKAPITPEISWDTATIRSYSFWVKINTIGAGGFTPLFTGNGGVVGTAFCRWSNSLGTKAGALRWALETWNTTSGCYISTEKVDGTDPLLPNIYDGLWHHIVVYNAVDNHANRGNIVDCEIYLDGSVLTKTIENVGTASIRGMRGDAIVFGAGNVGGSNSTYERYLEGNIDEFAYWDNYELTPTEVTEIWNGGTPTDLNLLSTTPTEWYRFGD